MAWADVTGFLTYAFGSASPLGCCAQCFLRTVARIREGGRRRYGVRFRLGREVAFLGVSSPLPIAMDWDEIV